MNDLLGNLNVMELAGLIIAYFSLKKHITSIKCEIYHNIIEDCKNERRKERQNGDE
jgi:hypothetical protein